MVNQTQAQTIAQPVSTKLAFQQMLTLMKPYTWFAPAWAFMVGAIASHSMALNFIDNPGQSIVTLGRLAIGVFMAGPLLTGFSQVLNDYCDRDVDAINQPERLIPSGKVSRARVIAMVFGLMFAALAVAAFLGGSVVIFVVIGIMLAVSYSVHPIRFKRNGWIGNLTVAIAYEGLAWLAGHATFQNPIPIYSWLPAIIYSLGAHGIMTINDFKSVEGDRKMGIKSIPVLLGQKRAAILAVATMTIAQIVVIGLMIVWGHTISALIIAVLLLAQVPSQKQLVTNPVNAMAVRFNMIGIPLFVWGMVAAALRI